METFITWSGWFFGFCGFLFGWWQHHTAAVDRQELAAIHGRGNAPFFVPSTEMFQHVYEDRIEPGNSSAWHAFGQNVLNSNCREVHEGMEKGDPVLLVVDNHGKGCQRVRVKLDGEPIRLLSETQLDEALGLQFFVYPFDPELRGKEQTLEVWFECDGFQNTHMYRTVHGVWELERTDPA